MATQANKVYNGYTNEHGKPINNDVNQWFEHGVKTTEPQVKRGICSTKQTLYVLLGVISFIVLAVVIMVPVIIANVNQNKSG